ncbi:uncharacterized protein LOC144110552 [Amblyomma americanum]
MELYEEAFKLQEMIESDMRAELSPAGELRCGLGDDSLDAFEPPSVWSTGISLISELDGLEGLLVDPQTGLPPHRNSATPATLQLNVTLAAAVTAATSAPTVQTMSSTSLEQLTVRPMSPSSPDDDAAVVASLHDVAPAEDPLAPGAYPKPAYSYSCLIAMALRNSSTGSLPVNEIYSFMTENFPYFRTAPSGWKNSVRHNLSLNKCFEKIEKPGAQQRKGCLWTLNPTRAAKMHDELLKWSRKDPAAIRRSMANPERLELLERGQSLTATLASGPGEDTAHIDEEG